MTGVGEREKEVFLAFTKKGRGTRAVMQKKNIRKSFRGGFKAHQKKKMDFEMDSTKKYYAFVSISRF